MSKFKDVTGQKTGRYTGKVLDSWSSGKFEVLDYCGNKTYNVLFFDTNNIEKFHSSAIKNGRINDCCRPVFLGKGYVGNGHYKAKVKGVITKEYVTWSNMMTRGYCPVYKSKQPTYKDCTVCEDWHNFQNFAKWCNEQPNFSRDGFALDKDLMNPKNLMYSPYNCCILPREINSEINLSQRKGITLRSSGNYMVRGTVLSGDKFKEKSLGSYKNYEEALEVYFGYKRGKILSLLKMYEEVLCEKIKTALLNYNPKSYL